MLAIVIIASGLLDLRINSFVDVGPEDHCDELVFISVVSELVDT